MENAALQREVATSVARTDPLSRLLESEEFQSASARVATALKELRADYAPLLERAMSLPDEAQCIEISDADSFEFANEWCRTEVDDTERKIKETIEPWRKLGHTIWQAFVDLRALGTDATDKARKQMNAKVVTYREKIRREREEAERRAAAERARLEHEAAIARTVNELLAGAVYGGTCLQADLDREAAARTAETRGDQEAAEALRGEVGRYDAVPEPELPLAAPVLAPPVEIVAPAIPTAKGTAFKENWKARLTGSKIALIRFVAEHPEYEELLEINQAAADKLAKAMKQKLSTAVPALEAYDDTTVARRRGR